MYHSQRRLDRALFLYAVSRLRFPFSLLRSADRADTSLSWIRIADISPSMKTIDWSVMLTLRHSFSFSLSLPRICFRPFHLCWTSYYMYVSPKTFLHPHRSAETVDPIDHSMKRGHPPAVPAPPLLPDPTAFSHSSAQESDQPTKLK